MYDLSHAATPPCAPILVRERHVLLVVHDQHARYVLADMLLDADFRLTLASSFDVADMLLDGSAGFDLLVADHALPGFGGGALARVACPGLPVLLIEPGSEGGHGVLEAVYKAIERWPVVPGYRT